MGQNCRKKSCFRRQKAGLWPPGGIRNIPSASAAYRWTLSAEDSHLFSTGSRFPDLWINAGPRLLANIAMTYAAGSPFTVTGSFGIPTRFPFTRQWRHCVGYSAVVVQRPLSYHVCRICQAQSTCGNACRYQFARDGEMRTPGAPLNSQERTLVFSKI